MGELGGEDKGELGGELRGEDISEMSSGDMVIAWVVKTEFYRMAVGSLSRERVTIRDPFVVGCQI